MNLFQTQVIKIIPLTQIQPNQINPNKMPKSTFDKLKLSLKKFGQLNPIIVRELNKDQYEIIDGEWRYRSCKALGQEEIQCKIIEAKDEDVVKLILATTIKGKHNLYETLDIVSKLAKTEDRETLKACNLDKNKVERRIKYHDTEKIKMVKFKKNQRDEKDTLEVKEIKDYPKILMFTFAPEIYDKVVLRLQSYDKDLSKALLQILEI